MERKKTAHSSHGGEKDFPLFGNKENHGLAGALKRRGIKRKDRKKPSLDYSEASL